MVDVLNDLIRYSLDDLKQLMRRLRDVDTGCPWDVEQTFKTIAPSTIEEAYEVVDAIERENFTHLREELGDLLFQVIFYTQMASEEQRFTFDDVVSDLVAKLVRRHPHVFPDGTLDSRVDKQRSGEDEANIKQRWEALKQQERQAKGLKGVLDDVPLNFPALTRAAKLQKRASSVGFDWSAMDGVLDKVEEELQEVKQALHDGDRKAVSEELGDLLFAVVNVCRHSKTEPESALRGANQKFEQRFQFIERSLKAQGIDPNDASLTLMDQLWDKAKQQESS